MTDLHLCLTHSPRPLDFSRSSRSFLNRRYSSPDRLNNLPDFESLSSKDAPTWHNDVTVWQLDTEKLSKPTLLHYLKKDYTANHAIILNKSLLICSSTFLEIHRLDSNSVKRISSSWFAGGHTVYPDLINEQLCVSCSASDAVLLFDLSDKSFTKAFRMPKESYGHNYDLKLSDDVRKRYINNDSQLTHLNSCYPCERGYLVTAFIQGAVGLFDFNGNYKELTSGFRGCHGARTRPGLNGFYFTDSAMGCLYEMDWSGGIVRKFCINSSWLHDSQWVANNSYLFSLSDMNELQLWDVQENHMIWTINLSIYGETSLLLSTSPKINL